MATIECRSPVTSTGNHVTGKYRYCTSADFTEHDCIPDGDIHGGNSSCCGYSWQNYRDISKTGGSAITYYASPNVVSLRVFQVDNVVCPGNGDISDGVRVTMWDDEGATGNFLGAVLFAHVADRQANGPYNGRSVYVGKVVNAWGYDCFSGPHIHMQEDTTGTTGSGLCCGVQVVADDDVVYRWYT